MNTFKKLGLTLAIAGVMAATAHAVPFTGAISFGGAATLSGGSGGVAGATTISFGAATVSSSSGALSVIVPGTAAVFNGFTFSPFGSPVPNLWAAGVGSMTALTQSVLDRDVSGPLPVLTLKGTGIATLPGFDPTPGNWSISVTQAGTTFGFGSSAASVPDAGSALILLGGAVIGLFGLARKFRFLA